MRFPIRNLARISHLLRHMGMKTSEITMFTQPVTWQLTYEIWFKKPEFLGCFLSTGKVCCSDW